jgi:hypothetical protein
LKAYTFHIGDFPTTATYLFNRPGHLHLQSKLGWKCCYALDLHSNCAAFIWFCISDKQALSPLKASFGSVEFTESLPPKILFEFFQYAVLQLQRIGVSGIQIKNPPDIYDIKKNALISVFLQNIGFEVSAAEVSSIIPVTETPYRDGLSSWEVRKLRQAKSKRLTFHQHALNDVGQVYRFIAQCRLEKAYSLSMSLEQVIDLSTTFPNEILVFSVQKEQEMAAACIAILVRKDILYTFYYDHGTAFHSLSPVVLLMEGMYGYCQLHKIRLLDLGTAALGGQPNFNLLEFKQNLGGIPSAKLTFQKKLL